MRWWGFVLMLAGCGRIGFGTPDDQSSDGAGSSADAPDGDTMLMTLGDGAVLAPFGTPMEQTALASTRDDQMPSLTADLLEIYFGSSRNCGNCFDIFVATRASTTAAWGAPTEMTALTNAAKDMAPEITPDGLTLYYASERQQPAGGSDIWYTTRPDRASAWASPQRETNLSTAGYDTDPALSDDGLTMMLTSDGAGGAYAAIYISTRASLTSPWSTPVLVSELDSPLHDSAASLRDGGHTLYMAREVTTGQMDIFYATRTSATTPFSTPVLLANVNAGTLDFDPWVSADQRTLYFASDRGGSMKIYEATR